MLEEVKMATSNGAKNSRPTGHSWPNFPLPLAPNSSKKIRAAKLFYMFILLC